MSSSLQAFGKYQASLQFDPVVKAHFQSLYDGMLEKNLCRIIEPYSEVDIAHVAKTIGLSNVRPSVVNYCLILTGKHS